MAIAIIILLVTRILLRFLYQDFSLPSWLYSLYKQSHSSFVQAILGIIISFFADIRHMIDSSINCDAMIRICSALGFINFSLSYFITARKSNIYSIDLSSVINKLAPWSSKVYILYALFIIAGIYCGAMEIIEVGVLCMIGMIISLISAFILAYLFAFNHKKTIEITEHYLLIDIQADKQSEEAPAKNAVELSDTAAGGAPDKNAEELSGSAAGGVPAKGVEEPSDKAAKNAADKLTEKPLFKCAGKQSNKKTDKKIDKKTDKKTKKQSKEQFDTEYRISQCGNYINSYFTERRNIPSDLVKTILDLVNQNNTEFNFHYDPTKKISYYLYLMSEYNNTSEEQSLIDESKNINNVFLARKVSDIIFDKLDQWDQAILLKHILIDCSKIIEINNQYIEDYIAGKKEVNQNFQKILTLFIGMIASLRYSKKALTKDAPVSEIWDNMFDVIRYSDIQTPSEIDSIDVQNFKQLFNLLIIIMESAALVEVSAQFTRNRFEKKPDPLFFDRYNNVLDHYNINKKLPLSCFAIGQIILAVSGQPYYNPEVACISSYDFIDWVTTINNQYKKEIESCQF